MSMKVGNLCQCCNAESGYLELHWVYIRKLPLHICPACRTKYCTVPIEEWYANITCGEVELKQMEALGLNPTDLGCSVLPSPTS